MNWTHTQALHFISLIKGRPALWDDQCIDYKIRTKRLEAMEEVAQLMDISVRDAESKWINLSKQYYREKRKCRESGFNFRSKWFAYRALDSLLSGSIRSQTINRIGRFQRRDTQRAGCPSTSGVQQARADPLNVVFKEAIKTLTAIRQSKIDNTPTYPPDDALECFGEYITATLRKFSPRIQSKAKYEISSVLYRADIENLGEHFGSASGLQEEDMNGREDINDAEDINEDEDINEAEDIIEAEYKSEPEDMNETKDINETEDLNEAEDDKNSLKIVIYKEKD